MPAAERSPLEPILKKDERKQLAGKVRTLLDRNPLGVGEIADALGIAPEVVVIALRELRARKKGTLRSTIRLGHVSWWWESASSSKSKRSKTTKADASPKGRAQPAKAAGKRASTGPAEEGSTIPAELSAPPTSRAGKGGKRTKSKKASKGQEPGESKGEPTVSP